MTGKWLTINRGNQHSLRKIVILWLVSWRLIGHLLVGSAIRFLTCLIGGRIPRRMTFKLPPLIGSFTSRIPPKIRHNLRLGTNLAVVDSLFSERQSVNQSLETRSEEKREFPTSRLDRARDCEREMAK